MFFQNQLLRLDVTAKDSYTESKTIFPILS